MRLSNDRPCETCGHPADLHFDYCGVEVCGVIAGDGACNCAGYELPAEEGETD